MKKRYDIIRLLLFLLAIVILANILRVSAVTAMPTPHLSEDELLVGADIAVEGELICVALTKRWIGDEPGVDVGYENGNFKSWLLISKVLKGDLSTKDTMEFFSRVYREGLWKNRREFVYVNTEEAITPGNKIRIYLNWNKKLKQYKRSHFNSGIILLQKSNYSYPTQVGVPICSR